MSPYFIQSGQKSKCLHFLKLALVSHSQEHCWIQQKCLHWLSKFLSLWWSYCHWIFFIFPKKLYYINWCPPTPIPLKAWKTTGQNLKIEIDSWSLNINRYIKSLNLHLMISYITKCSVLSMKQRFFHEMRCFSNFGFSFYECWFLIFTYQFEIGKKNDISLDMA